MRQCIMGTVAWLVRALAGGPGGKSAPLLHCTVDLAQQCILGTVGWLVHALAEGLGASQPPCCCRTSRPGTAALLPWFDAFLLCRGVGA